MKNSLILPAAAAIALLVFAPAARVGAIQKGKAQPTHKTDLKPGEYVWDAKTAPEKGAVDIVISLAAQKLAAYVDGVLVGRSTISSGSKGRETPPGIYMILEKNLTHHSNKYHEASMPFMERLTWSGLAIHAGNTPGHPESHGCVHVPEDFAKKLYALTEEGNTVLIANDPAEPGPTTDPNLLFPADAPGSSPSPSPAPDAAPAAFFWKPEEVPSGPVAIVFTSADKHVYVYRKGVEIGHAEIGETEGARPYGNYVYVALAGAGADGARPWTFLGAGDGSPALDMADFAKNLRIPPEFRQKLQSLIKPGATLVITDRPAHPSKPTDPD